MYSFPDNFLWGTATASYQIEGAVSEDGRGRSIWDTFCHTPGKVFHGDTGDIACDHYHLWRQDVELMARLGLNSYRFSVAWPGCSRRRGTFNQAGLDFYRRLLDYLAEHGIAAAVTLYHWDLPQALQDAGGDQPGHCRSFRRLRTRGRAAPGRRGAPMDHSERAMGVSPPRIWERHPRTGGADLSSAYRAAHHLLLGHGLAARAVRS